MAWFVRRWEMGVLLLLATGVTACGTASGEDRAAPMGGDVTTGADGDGPGGDGDGAGDGEAGDGDAGHGDAGGDGDDGVGAAGGSAGDGDITIPPQPGPAEAPPGYPAGPYGVGNPAVGDIIENLTFQGFPRIGDEVLVSTGEAQSITLADLRDEGAEFALIHTATMWCPSCRAAADDLAARGDELSNAGALIIELVLEGASGVEPTMPQLANWVTGSDLTVTTVAPGDDRTVIVFPSREYVYVIELDTMEVVWAEQALFTSPTITEMGIDALLDAMGE